MVITKTMAFDNFYFPVLCLPFEIGNFVTKFSFSFFILLTDIKYLAGDYALHVSLCIYGDMKK